MITIKADLHSLGTDGLVQAHLALVVLDEDHDELSVGDVVTVVEMFGRDRLPGRVAAVDLSAGVLLDVNWDAELDHGYQYGDVTYGRLVLSNANPWVVEDSRIEYLTPTSALALT